MGSNETTPPNHLVVINREIKFCQIIDVALPDKDQRKWKKNEKIQVRNIKASILAITDS